MTRHTCSSRGWKEKRGEDGCLFRDFMLGSMLTPGLHPSSSLFWRSAKFFFLYLSYIVGSGRMFLPDLRWKDRRHWALMLPGHWLCACVCVWDDVASCCTFMKNDTHGLLGKSTCWWFTWRSFSVTCQLCRGSRGWVWEIRD